MPGPEKRPRLLVRDDHDRPSLGGTGTDLKLIWSSGLMALSVCGTKATVIRNRVATAANPLARNSPGMDDIGINGLAKMFEPKMFEVAIYSIVVVAIAYSAFLWRMGRRADVLHGEFIAPSSSPQSSSQSPASTLDIEASLKSLLRTIERDLCESGN
jgi:hypothetical protein